MRQRQEDPLTDEFIAKLKKDVESGKPMTKEEIDNLVSQIEYLDSAGDNRTKAETYHLQDLDNTAATQGLIDQRV